MRWLFTLFTLCSISGFGQITITDADMPSQGDTFRISVVNTDNWGLDPTPAGAGLTWDFSVLIPDTQRVDTMFSVGSTPVAYQIFFNNGFQYPDYVADYGYPGPGFDVFGMLTFSNVYNYYRADNDAYRHLGFGANINGLPTPVQHDSIDEVYNFPLDYSDIDQSYMEYTISIPNMGTYRQQKWTFTEAEGWGTLITPYGSFNTLKVRKEYSITDSIYIDSFAFGQSVDRPLTFEYQWLGAGTGVPLLSITTGPNGNITRIEYQDSIRAVSVDEISLASTTNVFPNPTNGMVTVDAKSLIEAYKLNDLAGREVVPRTEVRRSNFQFDVSKEPPGVYFLQIYSSDKQGVVKIIKN